MGLRQCGWGAALVAILMLLGAVALFLVPSVLTIHNITNASRRVLVVAALIVSAGMVLAASCRDADSAE